MRAGSQVPYKRRSKAKPSADEDWYRIARDLKATLATGRTRMRCYTLADDVEIGTLWQEHSPTIAYLLNGGAGSVRANSTMMLDMISTAILMEDRRERRLADGGDEHRQIGVWESVKEDGILMPGQVTDRQRHEVLMPDLDFFARECERDDWRWHEGGWLGAAPRIIQEHLPREFNDVQRQGRDHVGIFWNHPWIA